MVLEFEQTSNYNTKLHQSCDLSSRPFLKCGDDRLTARDDEAPVEATVLEFEQTSSCNTLLHQSCKLSSIPFFGMR